VQNTGLTESLMGVLDDMALLSLQDVSVIFGGTHLLEKLNTRLNSSLPVEMLTH
jgi:hypothetical protein